MELGSFGEIPVITIDHKAGMFVAKDNSMEPANRMELRFISAAPARKLFVSEGSSWSLVCGSKDAFTGNHTTQGELTCGTQPFCRDCKFSLVVAAVNENGPLLLDLTSSAAKTVLSALSLPLRRGAGVVETEWLAKLSRTTSKRVSFAEVVLRESSTSKVAVPSLDTVDRVYDDMISYTGRTFVPRGNKAGAAPSLDASVL